MLHLICRKNINGFYFVDFANCKRIFVLRNMQYILSYLYYALITKKCAHIHTYRYQERHNDIKIKQFYNFQFSDLS